MKKILKCIADFFELIFRLIISFDVKEKIFYVKDEIIWFSKGIVENFTFTIPKEIEGKVEEDILELEEKE